MQYTRDNVFEHFESIILMRLDNNMQQYIDCHSCFSGCLGNALKTHNVFHFFVEDVLLDSFCSFFFCKGKCISTENFLKSDIFT
jgi:hypothetical protein